jgi:hypothetical protein
LAETETPTERVSVPERGFVALIHPTRVESWWETEEKKFQSPSGDSWL